MDAKQRGRKSTVLSDEKESVGEREVEETTSERSQFMLKLLMRTKEMMNEDKLDEETTRMVERIVVLRLSTKHVNLGIRQLEIKRDEIKELAGLMKFEGVKKEIAREKHLDAWAEMLPPLHKESETNNV